MVVLRRLLTPSPSDMFHSDASSASSMQTRDSAPRSPSSPPSPGARRPKLLRPCATEPSLAAPNMGTRPSVVAGSGPTRRASELLSRVAVLSANIEHVSGSPRCRSKQLEDIIEPALEDGCLQDETLYLCSGQSSTYCLTGVLTHWFRFHPPTNMLPLSAQIQATTLVFPALTLGMPRRRRKGER